jgi:hypothetical protein
MNKVIIILIFGIILFNNIPSNAEGANFPYSIGPFITLKGGVNAADVPDGMKNGFAINGLPDFGATGYIPLGDKSQFGIVADLAYSTYSFEQKFTNNEENPWVTRVSYLSLAPNMYIYGFTVGLNFGLPLRGNIVYTNSEDDVDTDLYNMFVEFRIGGMFPVYDDATGRLNLIIQFGYFLTEQMKDNYSSSYNYHPASGAIGVSYLFNLSE